jgi:hypothetical protein
MLRLAGREVKKCRQLDIIASSEAVVGVRITSIEERRNIYLLLPEPQSGGKIFALLVDINFFDNYFNNTRNIEIHLIRRL